MLTFKHQANRRVGDPTPDGDTSEMDWDEFEFAVKKVCEYLKFDPESLLDEEGPRAAAPAENDTKKVFYKKKGEPQAPKPTGPVAQVNTLACTSLRACVRGLVRASEVWAVAIYSNRHDTNLCVCVCACACCVCIVFVRADVCMYSKQLFNKWSSTKKKGSRGKSVDFKEFCEMLKVLQLKVGKHKAQEIFRQVIMCMCNLSSGASPAVRLTWTQQ